MFFIMKNINLNEANDLTNYDFTLSKLEFINKLIESGDKQGAIGAIDEFEANGQTLHAVVSHYMDNREFDHAVLALRVSMVCYPTAAHHLAILHVAGIAEGHRNFEAAKVLFLEAAYGGDIKSVYWLLFLMDYEFIQRDDKLVKILTKMVHKEDPDGHIKQVVELQFLRLAF